MCVLCSLNCKVLWCVITVVIGMIDSVRSVSVSANSVMFCLIVVVFLMLKVVVVLCVIE